MFLLDMRIGEGKLRGRRKLFIVFAVHGRVLLAAAAVSWRFLFRLA